MLVLAKGLRSIVKIARRGVCYSAEISLYRANVYFVPRGESHLKASLKLRQHDNSKIQG